MTDKEMKLENYRKANLTAVKGQTVLTGSSLMEMFPAAEWCTEKILYNRAVGGFVTEELYDTLDVCVYELEPSKVFINIGTNDLSWADRSPEYVIGNYEKIISAIEERLPGVQLYLMAYYPVNPEAASEEMRECLRIRSNEKLTAANALVKALAEKHGQRYIDINRNLTDERGQLRAEYTIEGLHINEAGYRAIYDDFIQYV